MFKLNNIAGLCREEEVKDVLSRGANSRRHEEVKKEGAEEHYISTLYEHEKRRAGTPTYAISAVEEVL